MAHFVFVLRSDDNEKATRCFQFAKIAHDKGHVVNLFLVDDGVFWAQQGKDGSLKATTGDCPADYIPYLVEKNVATGVCTPCVKGRNLDAAAFHPTMQLDTGGHLIDLAADARIFNF